MSKKFDLNKEQQNKNQLGVSLSSLFGAEVVGKHEYDKMNEERKQLLKENEEIPELQSEVIKYYCYFLGFKNYHSKWKPTTRQIEERTSLLINEKLMLDFDQLELPENIRENVTEAYKCYIHNQEIAAYIMILRSVELAIHYLFDESQNPENKHIPIKQKLDWVNRNYKLGAEYHIMKGYLSARNEAIHDIHKPTERGLLAAFETINHLVELLVKLK